MPSAESAQAVPVAAGRVLRHAAADRWFHWITALAVLTLLGTAFLPIMGLQFPWVTAHWIAGWVLIAAVLFHIVRALLCQPLGTMWIGSSDIRDGIAVLRFNLRQTSTPPPKPGKYSLAQKFIHLAFTVVVLTASVTGGMMMVKIDTPWWNRNLYWISDAAWGYVYVLHGLSALLTVTMLMTHVYFAFRPEKLLFLRAMFRGWITRDEFLAHHDPKRWQVDE